MRKSRFILTVGLILAAVPSARSDEPPNSPAAIAAAISRLGDGRYEIRENASKQLAHSGREAIAPLYAAAAGENLEVTWRAVKALAQILDSDDEATFDAAEESLERLEASTNPSAARRAAAALETQPSRRWKRALARFEAAGGWSVFRKPEESGGAIAAHRSGSPAPTYLVIGPDWKGGDAGLINVKRIDSALEIERKLGVYVVDGCNISPQALEEMQNSLHLMEFVPRGKARLAVSFNFDLRGRSSEVAMIEPEAAELTREMLKKGDVIVKYDGETLIDFDHLTRITRKHDVGDRLPVEVRRNGEPVEIEIELTGWRKPEKKADEPPKEK
jgi:hypothetical protein